MEITIMDIICARIGATHLKPSRSSSARSSSGDMEGATKVVRLVRARLVLPPLRRRRRILLLRQSPVPHSPLQRGSPVHSACLCCVVLHVSATRDYCVDLGWFNLRAESTCADSTASSCGRATFADGRANFMLSTCRPGCGV